MIYNKCKLIASVILKGGKYATTVYIFLNKMNIINLFV